MKTIIAFLLCVFTTYAQSVTVNKTKLSYDKKTKTMLLNISESEFRVDENSNLKVEVKIVKEYDLSMTINGVSYSMTEPFFSKSGYRHPMFWSYTTETPGNCKAKTEFIYQFSKLQPGEYILVITKICDNKYIEDKKIGSIVIQ